MTIVTLTELFELIDGGGTPDYLFFWGHRPAKNGAVSNSCFSQWFESPFEVDGVTYSTAEHFMMAEKARLFADMDTLRRILVATTPAEVKGLGREIKGFNDELWLERRFGIVIAANLNKFSQNRELLEFLLRTGDQVIVEASPVDSIWGIGLAADDPRARNPKMWEGQNLLGFALMHVRDQLRTERNA